MYGHQCPIRVESPGELIMTACCNADGARVYSPNAIIGGGWWSYYIGHSVLALSTHWTYTLKASPPALGTAKQNKDTYLRCSTNALTISVTGLLGAIYSLLQMVQ